MKVIDLLNKIANGEKIKAKLKFKMADIVITYYGNDNYYKVPEYGIEYLDKGCTTHEFTFSTLIKCLNDEVEIIEEDKKIEKIDKYNIEYSFTNNQMVLADKINEIIDKINNVEK